MPCPEMKHAVYALSSSRIIEGGTTPAPKPCRPSRPSPSPRARSPTASRPLVSPSSCAATGRSALRLFHARAIIGVLRSGQFMPKRASAGEPPHTVSRRVEPQSAIDGGPLPPRLPSSRLGVSARAHARSGPATSHLALVPWSGVLAGARWGCVAWGRSVGLERPQLTKEEALLLLQREQPRTVGGDHLP